MEGVIPGVARSLGPKHRAMLITACRYFYLKKFGVLQFVSGTFKGCLPLKHGSDRHETLPKRVSDDPQHFNFQPKKMFPCEFFGVGNRFWLVLASFGESTGKWTSK